MAVFSADWHAPSMDSMQRLKLISPRWPTAVDDRVSVSASRARDARITVHTPQWLTV